MHANHDQLPPHELGALPEERPSGEDHRDGHPGYDFDEQAVYLAKSKGDADGERPPGPRA